MLGTVVVGYDGRESARDALALGEILAEPVRADLIVARVYRWEPAEDRRTGPSPSSCKPPTPWAAGRRSS
ncbi:MAG TPA: hypothetical protein VKB17_03965 [Thermoleophilaceae bacterium]|nr:hypothetical protein [Thermoleophilaceae bacterium]